MYSAAFFHYKNIYLTPLKCLSARKKYFMYFLLNVKSHLRKQLHAAQFNRTDTKHFSAQKVITEQGQSVGTQEMLSTNMSVCFAM